MPPSRPFATPLAPSRTLRSPAELAAAGLVARQAVPRLDEVASRYTVAVTPTILALIDPNDPYDPIARQYLPDSRELEHHPDERSDPIGDDAHSPVEGLVHRYPDRVLLKLASVCAVYCRFCFRRESVGQGPSATLSDQALTAALDYIRARPEIWEVIVTGGDPLVLSPRRLRDLTRAVAQIDHVKVIRWHTRLPVADPERVTDALAASLRLPPLTTVVAVHANHPRELTPQARAALARLADAGIVLVSQTVLLKGVNNDVDTLAALMRGFVEARVKPYYLHHGDLAPGTAHFRTSLAEGQALMTALRGRVSGLCQPIYVLDIPGGYGKASIGQSDLDTASQTVMDFNGRVHPYPSACEGTIPEYERRASKPTR